MRRSNANPKPVLRTPPPMPTQEQLAFDESAKRISCGDLTPMGNLLRNAGEQDDFVKAFAGELEACGVQVHKIEMGHDAWEVTVTDAKAKAMARTSKKGAVVYPTSIEKKHRNIAFYEPDVRKWFLIYQDNNSNGKPKKARWAGYGMYLILITVGLSFVMAGLWVFYRERPDLLDTADD